MATQRVLTQSFFIQSLGAGLGFFVAVVVAQRFGPSAQGMFATARAWVDMASLVLLAGLPQALIHEVSSGKLDVHLATKLSLAFAAVGSLALYAVTTLAAPLSPPFPDAHVRAMLVGAACLATIYGLLRVLALTSRRYLIYNLVSAAPSALLVVGVLMIPVANATYLAVVLVAVFLTCSLTLAGTMNSAIFTRASKPLSVGNVLRLVRYGVWSSAQQVAAQAAILGSYVALQAQSNEAAGYFSVAMVIVSVVTLPLNIIGPILLNRWVEEYADSGRTNHFVSATCGFFLLSIAATIVSLPAIYIGLPIVFGAEFVSARPACLVMGASTFLLIQRRVLSTAGLAFGMPRECAIAEASRTAVTLAMLWGHPTLDGAIAAWCVGECVGLALISAALNKRLELPYKHILGTDASAMTNLLRNAFRKQSAGLS